MNELKLALLGLMVMYTGLLRAQERTIILANGERVSVSLVSEKDKKRVLNEYDGQKDERFRKPSTARTYILNNKQILVEFYDRSAVLIDDSSIFRKLAEVKFFKTYIDFLRQNITYKIELDLSRARMKAKEGKLIDSIKSYLPDKRFELYQLPFGQILYLSETDYYGRSGIYENIKAVASEHLDVLDQYYDGLDQWKGKVLIGDSLEDYTFRMILIEPHEVQQIMKSHNLELIRRKVYVDQFYGNLYKAKNGTYYVLIDEVKQKSGAGRSKKILSVRIYESLIEVAEAEKRYQSTLNKLFEEEHFYQKISDVFGNKWIDHVKPLQDSLTMVLNIDKDQLRYDSVGMLTIDDAIHWNHSEFPLFHRWFPAVLAYYGETYIRNKGGEWKVQLDSVYKVWIPRVILPTGQEAFDVLDLFKSLYEWPIPLETAGDWDGWLKRIRSSSDTKSNDND